MAFEIEFYKTKDGKEPVVDFLDSLDDKMAAKLAGLMEVLEEKGTELRGKKIIATNGFVKKTQKTPPKELKLAKERRADWQERHKEVRDDT